MNKHSVAIYSTGTDRCTNKILLYTLKNLRHVSAKYVVTRLAETCSSLLRI